MVVSGENEGPLRPSYKKVGGILFSENAVEFDMIVLKLMGYDWKKIPVIKNAIEDRALFNSDGVIRLNSNEEMYSGMIDNIQVKEKFIPPRSWYDYL